MKLGRILNNSLLFEAIHPDMYATAVAINKKIAAQLKDISVFIPEENPDIYKGGWIIGHLAIGEELRPVAMLMDGSITMRTHLFGDAHSTWASVDKFLIYAKKQLKKNEIPLAKRFLDAISEKGNWTQNYITPDGKEQSYYNIPESETPDPNRYVFYEWEWSWDKIAKFVGINVPLEAPVKKEMSTDGLDDTDEFHSGGGRAQVRLAANGVTIVDHQKPPVNPTWWPPEVITGLRNLYTRLSKAVVQRTIDATFEDIEHRESVRRSAESNAIWKAEQDAKKEAEIQAAVDARLRAREPDRTP